MASVIGLTMFALLWTQCPAIFTAMGAKPEVRGDVMLCVCERVYVWAQTSVSSRAQAPQCCTGPLLPAPTHRATYCTSNR